jgi:nucleotide-binding universal stress UspA family protein
MGPLVCCVDDSDGARRALVVSERLATALGLELVLVHVEPPTELPGVSAAAAGQERLRDEELHDAPALVARLVREAGVDTSYRLRTAIGPAAETIVELCTEERAELVAIGSRGRGTLTSALLGSVSAAVAARAPCPCLVVPPSAAGVATSADAA